jgi:hypothetical protein
MIPSLGPVKVNSLVLKKGETEIIIEATVTDVIGVVAVGATVYDPSSDKAIIASVELKLVKGDKLGGIYSGIIVIPLGIKDGHYIIMVTAYNSMSRTYNSTSYAVNTENELIVEREESGAGGIGGPGGVVGTGNTDVVVGRTGGRAGGTGGVGDESDTSATEKCCCKVTITVSAGPVNIYVCSHDSKPE